MTVTYQVGDGGNLDIDFWVSAMLSNNGCHMITHAFVQLVDPVGVALHKDLLSTTGTASVTVETDGRYTYCFSNEMSTLADKLVRYVLMFASRLIISVLTMLMFSFNVHGIIYVQDDGKLLALPLPQVLNSLYSPGTIAPIEREVRDLASGLQAVKDEQEYIVVRERRHRDTAESTNSRVVWWSIFQGIVLVRCFCFCFFFYA